MCISLQRVAYTILYQSRLLMTGASCRWAPCVSSNSSQLVYPLHSLDRLLARKRMNNYGVTPRMTPARRAPIVAVERLRFEHNSNRLHAIAPALSARLQANICLAVLLQSWNSGGASICFATTFHAIKACLAQSAAKLQMGNALLKACCHSKSPTMFIQQLRHLR